jgi:polyhydroxyalkanoate synthase
MASAAQATAKAEVERALQRNIKGIGYFASPAPVMGATSKDILIAEGPWRLYHYHPRVNEVYRVPVVLVMATTHRGYIFDLTPGQSFVEFLLLRGYDVYVVDWEAPRPQDRHLDMKSYVEDFVGGSIARVEEESGESDVSLIGYCMGGVLSLMWAALHSELGPKNLVLFTTPVNFKALKLFQAWFDPSIFDVDLLVDTLGLAPADMLFNSFEMLRPVSRAVNNIRLIENRWDEEFVKAHRMFERWNTDILPLAGEYFRDTVKKLTWENALLDGTMTVGDRIVDLSRITCPVFHATAEHDHIVGSEASAPLIELVGSTDKHQVVLPGGHVSLIAGPNAVRRLWPKVDEWLRERSV